MTTSPSQPAARPRLVVRVGVTGHRDLGTDSDGLRRLATTLAALLTDVRRIAARIQQAEAGATYAPEEPLFRLVSPLAMGADQLTAALAVDQGFELQAVLPFAEPAYRLDFEESQADRLFAPLRDVLPERFSAGSAAQAFQMLLADAGERVLVLDGSRDDPETRDRSYETAGRAVVQHCDLLVAIWNGARASGKGGTGDIVEYAVREGTRVVYIDPARPDGATLLADPGDLPAFATGTGQAAEPHGGATTGLKALSDHLRTLLLPAPHDEGHDSDGILHRLAALIHARHVSLQTYLAERDAHVQWPGRLFRLFRRTFGTPGAADPEQPDATLNQSEEAFRHLHVWPDGLAVKYGEYYRSAYLGIITLGVLALSSAIVAVGYEPLKKPSTLVELGLLVVVVAVFVREKRRSWHRRWLSYRLLAELFRQMRFLALVGHAMPVDRSLLASRARTAEAEWVLRHFQAFVRTVPFARTDLGGPWLPQVRHHVLAHLIDGQIAYHRRTQRVFERVDNRLAGFAELLFLLTLLVVLGKVVGFVVPSLAWLAAVPFGMAAGILPACAAGIFALRHQGEFEAVATRSAIMERELVRLRQEIASMPLDAPLASERLSRALFAVAELMLSDLGEWAVLFTVKPVEAA